RVGPGELLGEVSLLLGTPRTATVVVCRAARLLALEREPFERVLMRNAKALEHISRALSKRLAVTSRGQVVPKTATIIAVTSEPGLRGKSLVAATLAELLQRLARREAVLVRVGSPRNGARSTEPVPLDSGGRPTPGALRSHVERRDGEAARL